MGQHGNMNGIDQGGPNGSHWGDRIHIESSNNHNLDERRILSITRTLLPQLLTGNPIGAQEKSNQRIDINTSYREYDTIDKIYVRNFPIMTSTTSKTNVHT